VKIDIYFGEFKLDQDYFVLTEGSNVDNILDSYKAPEQLITRNPVKRPIG
jgi:hypothetical protein